MGSFLGRCHYQIAFIVKISIGVTVGTNLVLKYGLIIINMSDLTDELNGTPLPENLVQCIDKLNSKYNDDVIYKEQEITHLKNKIHSNIIL